MDEQLLFQLMHGQLSHAHRLTGDLHLTDDGVDYLIASLRLGADLADAWRNDNFARADEILTEDYLLENYACDGVDEFVWKYAERVAPSKS
jgi:hypothetical protein